MSVDADLVVRPISEAGRPDLRDFLTRRWGSPEIVSRGEVHDAAQAPAMVALRDEELVGLVTYRVRDGECEVLTLNAFERRQGIGSTLMDAITARARDEGCQRLWLITTNDNLGAIAFYKQRGMRLAAVHRGAADLARKLKPQIPEINAENGIRISDELEFDVEL
jgi:ribosomal protein S18 acetylase RimI-like enzyme